MKNLKQQSASAIGLSFDGHRSHRAMKRSADTPCSHAHKRGGLDLTNVGAQHRRYLSFYEDLLN